MHAWGSSRYAWLVVLMAVSVPGLSQENTVSDTQILANLPESVSEMGCRFVRVMMRDADRPMVCWAYEAAGQKGMTTLECFSSSGGEFRKDTVGVEGSIVDVANKNGIIEVFVGKVRTTNLLRFEIAEGRFPTSPSGMIALSGVPWQFSNVVGVNATGCDYVLVGEHDRSQSDPAKAISRIASTAGTYGKTQGVFAAKLGQDKVVGKCALAGDAGLDEFVSNICAASEGQVLHSIWVKGIEGSDVGEKLIYSSFDTSKDVWSAPVEICALAAKTGSFKEYVQECSLISLGKGPLCVWSVRLRGSFESLSGEEQAKLTGLYFSRNDGTKWSSPMKIQDGGELPLLGSDGKGTAFVFWVDGKTGLSFRKAAESGWSEAVLGVSDERMIVYRVKNYPYRVQRPFDVQVDGGGNVHIAYVRENENANGRAQELVYAKLAPGQTATTVGDPATQLPAKP